MRPAWQGPQQARPTSGGTDGHSALEPQGPSYMQGGTFASSVVTEMGLTRPSTRLATRAPLPAPEPQNPQPAGR